MERRNKGIGPLATRENTQRRNEMPTRTRHARCQYLFCALAFRSHRLVSHQLSRNLGWPRAPELNAGLSCCARGLESSQDKCGGALSWTQVEKGNVGIGPLATRENILQRNKTQTRTRFHTCDFRATSIGTSRFGARPSLVAGNACEAI